jgi:hypothetical protein
MSDIPWNHEASLVRTTGAGEESERHGILQQLVEGFLELPPERQRGLILRAAGPDWCREWDEAEIRELAAKPEITGAFGRWDSERDPDEPALDEPEDETTLIEAGISGPTRETDGMVGRIGSEAPDERQ